MALYVSLSLLAALSLIDGEQLSEPGTVFKVIWGTTVGLALVHWFAFRLSGHLVSGGGVDKEDAAAAVAQLSGALVVAVLATFPVVVLKGEQELSAARLVLAVFIAAVGWVAARSNGATRARSLIISAVTLVVAGGIAVLKNVLSGH